MFEAVFILTSCLAFPQDEKRCSIRNWERCTKDYWQFNSQYSQIVESHSFLWYLGPEESNQHSTEYRVVYYSLFMTLFQSNYKLLQFLHDECGQPNANGARTESLFEVWSLSSGHWSFIGVHSRGYKKTFREVVQIFWYILKRCRCFMTTFYRESLANETATLGYDRSIQRLEIGRWYWLVVESQSEVH